MDERTLLLEELKREPIEKVLEEVASGGVPIVIRLPGGRQVVISPQSPLKPLPVFEGYVPEGWENALYPTP